MSAMISRQMDLHRIIDPPPASPLGRKFAHLRKKWGDKFVPPKVTGWQAYHYFTRYRLEVVSPHGYRRRGIIGITTGWQPSLLLVHRANNSGSWDILTTDDILVGCSHRTESGRWSPMLRSPHDELAVAVYTGRCEQPVTGEEI